MSLIREFGNTDIKVSALGFGAGHIGDPALDDKFVEKLLNNIVDEGVNLFDTARGYGLSEERIGRFLVQRRKDIVLSTKVGYSVPGHNDWTYSCVLAGIDESLSKLKTDYIDIVHLHSCSLQTLEQGEVIYALEKAKEQGKVRSAAYSGENEALDYAIHCGRFDSIQTSINIADQRNLNFLLPDAKLRYMGVIAKRPLANAPWRFTEHPQGHYCEEYWLRLQKMNLQYDISIHEIAIRFAAFTFGVDSCIVGTTKIEHVKQNMEFLKKGPLSQVIYDNIRMAFINNDNEWIGQI